MILCVPDVLDAAQLRAVHSALRAAQFADGGSSAGWAVRDIKRNQQLVAGMRGYEPAEDIVRNAYLRNATLQTALLPLSNTRILFNRYGTGMQYGPHVDAPVMGSMDGAVRTDVAITLFLTEPNDYEGGELAMLTHGMSSQFKLNAGSVILYPANTLHHVTPVTRGVRDAAIIWVQSQVRDPAQRELLWDLENAKRQVFNREGKSPTFDAISKSHANLLRMWAEI